LGVAQGRLAEVFGPLIADAKMGTYLGVVPAELVNLVPSVDEAMKPVHRKTFVAHAAFGTLDGRCLHKIAAAACATPQVRDPRGAWQVTRPLRLTHASATKNRAEPESQKHSHQLRPLTGRRDCSVNVARHAQCFLLMWRGSRLNKPNLPLAKLISYWLTVPMSLARGVRVRDTRRLGPIRNRGSTAA